MDSPLEKLQERIESILDTDALSLDPENQLYKELNVSCSMNWNKISLLSALENAELTSLHSRVVTKHEDRLQVTLGNGCLQLRAHFGKLQPDAIIVEYRVMEGGASHIC